MSIRTLGRRPTLGEVLGYYQQDEFLNFLSDTCCTRRVVMVIPQKQHWEPLWEKDEILAQDAEVLRQYILKNIAEHLPEVGPNDRPNYYPSFHQSIGLWTDGKEKRERRGEADCVFEADLSTWRDSFRDVYAVVDMMDRYGVCYHHRFSGHRSLHITIPGDALPHPYRGKGTQRLVSRLLAWSGSQAHRLPRITRMPYSLNEVQGWFAFPLKMERSALFVPGKPTFT